MYDTNVNLRVTSPSMDMTAETRHPRIRFYSERRLIAESRTRRRWKLALLRRRKKKKEGEKKSVIRRQWTDRFGRNLSALSLAAVIDRSGSRNLTTRDTFGNTPMICETVRSASMPECVWGPRKRNPFFRPHVLTRWSPSVTSTPLFRSTVHGEGCMSYGMPMMPSYSPSKFSTCI